MLTQAEHDACWIILRLQADLVKTHVSSETALALVADKLPQTYRTFSAIIGRGMFDGLTCDQVLTMLEDTGQLRTAA